MYPKSFLTCLFETCVVTLGFSSERVDFLERNTFTFNGKSVIIRKSNIFGTATIFLSIVPTLVIARTEGCFRSSVRSAVFLTSSAIIGKFSVIVHSKTCFADRMSVWQLLGIFSVTLVKRDNTFAVINVFDSIVNCFDIITFVC